MRKKVGILLCIVLVVLSFTGCSATQQGYLKELDKLNEWEAYNIKLTASLDGAGQNKLFGEVNENNWSGKVDIDGYINVKDERAHLAVKLSGKIAEEIPNIEIFINQNKIYMNKSFLTNYYTGSRFDKVNAQYIGWPITDELETLHMSSKNEKWEKKLNEILQNIEVNMPLEEKARTYTLSINHDQAGVISTDCARGLYAQLDELIALYLEVIQEEKNLSDESYNVKRPYENDGYYTQYGDYYESMAYYKDKADEFKKTIDEVLSDEEYFEMFTYFVQGALYGSHLDMKTSFTDESMTSTYKGKLQLLKQYSTNYDIAMTVQKAERQQVVLPGNVKVLDADEYEMLKTPDYASYYLEKVNSNVTVKDIEKSINDPEEYNWVDCFSMEGAYYIELQDLAAVLDYTVRYDEEKKQSYLVSDQYMNYEELYALEDELDESYYNDEIAADEYYEKIDELYENWVDVEADNSKRFYLNTLTIEDNIYATLEELDKVGFESQVSMVAEDDEYDAAYIKVYAPLEEIK